MHQKYIDGLCNLYKEHVHKYGNPDVKLVITWMWPYLSESQFGLFSPTEVWYHYFAHEQDESHSKCGASQIKLFFSPSLVLCKKMTRQNSWKQQGEKYNLCMLIACSRLAFEKRCIKSPSRSKNTRQSPSAPSFISVSLRKKDARNL